METNLLDSNADENQLNTEIEMEMIRFAIVPSRLIFLDDSNTWLNFFHEYNGEHIDYTAYQLHKYFTKKILPKIKKYKLEEGQLMLLELLDLHPIFKGTETGYQLIDVPAKLLKEKVVPQPNKHITVTPCFNPATGTIQKPNLSGTNADSSGTVSTDTNCRTVLITQTDDTQFSPLTAHSRKSKLKLENQCLLSLIAGSVDEVNNHIMLPISEISARFHQFKDMFEDKGQLPDSLNIPVGVLLNNLKFHHNLFEKFNRIGLDLININTTK